ncbi:MAG TPA: protein kinase, partial [Polyangiaceae bacterium]|nr:protein kinase [Polyangiaceae bacterium]
MSATDPFRMIGKTLAGHFLVQSLVGEGRFTIVYKGLHIGPKKPVALKCYKLGGWLDAATAETFLRRFREESKASSQVAKEQPAFVRSIGSGMTTSDDGVYIPYTVLEWLDGRSLARSVAERNQRNEQPYTLTALLQRLGPAVNGALVHAHTQKVFHGDINPGSFFLVGAEGIKLLDLGVAKVMRDLSREIAPQTALEKIFSPGHAAPEQFDPSQGEWSTATDVYALAMVLLEAMRGRPLLESHDLKDFARAALDPRRRPTPRAWGLSVFDPIEAVFARAVALAPAERWQDAGEFWAELEDAVRSEAPTRRVLVEDFAPDDDEAPELEVPSTEPRPHVAGHGAPFAPLPTAAKGVKPSKGATDDTSPNGALMDLAPAPLVSPPTAAPPVDRMSPVPPKSSAVDNAASGRPSVPRGLQPVKPVVGGLASPPSASSSGSASGSANLFKISPPTPSSATPTKNSATPPPGPTPLRPSTPHAPPQVTAPMVAAAPPSPIVAPPVLTSAA